MIDLIETLLITIVTLGILVAVHEYGHFWVARRCGVKVLRFSIGFGKAIWRRVGRDGTEYVVAVVPLGGFVKMLDEREGPIAEDEKSLSFNAQPLLSRMAIVTAGPIANFLLAILSFYLLYMIGVRGVAPLIGKIDKDSIAEAAGLEPGQEIVAIDGERTATRQAVMMQLLKRLGESGEIHFAAKYPQSDLVYDSTTHITDWLKAVDDPDLLTGLGIEFVLPRVEPRIAEVSAGSPAELGGMLPGDHILKVDDDPIADWDQWVKVVRAKAGIAIRVEIERPGATVVLTITPAKVTLADGKMVGQIGVSAQIPEWPPDMLRIDRYGPFSAWKPAVVQTWSLTAFTLDSVKKMVIGLISPKNLSGPITIAKVAAASARSGFEAYISFLALLSISLGVLNLLPIPVLDGGHLLYCVIEGIKGSPVSVRAQTLGYQVGLFILIGVMMLAFYNDIHRLVAN